MMKDPDSLRITAVGDISLGDHPVCVGHGMRYVFGKYHNLILTDVKEYFGGADIVFGNLETVASNKGLRPKSLSSIEMRGDPSSLTVLKNAGFNLLGVANNHALQHGTEAFKDTLEHMERIGIKAIGVDDPITGETKPFVYKKGNKEHVFVAVSMRPEEWQPNEILYSQRESEQELIEEMSQLKTRFNGFLIVSIHWGLEYLDFPGPDQVRLGRALIDAGVDVVVGHHPHVLQPYECYSNGLILYSLGNFVFDLWHPETKLTSVAQVTLTDNALPQITFRAVYIGEDFILKKTNEHKIECIDNFKELNKNQIEWINSITPHDYWKRYKANLAAVKSRKYRYFSRNIYKYSLFMIVQTILRTFTMRVKGH